jgi:uncharacterized membrane protein YkvA (DUF1232 family)
MSPERAMTAGGAGFPREEFGGLVRRLPRYGRLAWALARDPRLSRVRRAAVLAAAADVVSPIDLVPGIIPVAGQLDDLLVALAAIRIALDGLRPDARAERLASVGLSQAELEADLRTTGSITAWLARSGVRVGRQVASAAVQTGWVIGGRLLQAGRDRAQRARKPG